jgi:pSer/pThr/pTyr-binding forkhead associated (FHA) protein
MRARLVPIDNAPAIELEKELTLVGRTEDCDIRIEHKSVSKLHCVLVKTDGLILLRDLGSTNGTRVNGQRIRRAALLPNDHLAIAAFRYKVKFGDVPDDSDEADIHEPIDANRDAEDDAPEDKPLDPRSPPLRRNALPDYYPDKAKKLK